MNKVRTYRGFANKEGSGVICPRFAIRPDDEPVTAIDARDVEGLVAAARGLDQALWDQIMGRDVYIGEFRERLKEALAPFDSSTQVGE